MNDFLCKSVQYSGSRKGWPRERKSVERYGGSRWYKEWFGAHTFSNSSWSERSIGSSMVSAYGLCLMLTDLTRPHSPVLV